MKYSNAMTIPRKAKPVDKPFTEEGWFYVSHNHIEVHAKCISGSIGSVTLTRKQLERALSIMDEEK